jgi:mRNA interferase MazF
MKFTPSRGDVIWINFNPQAGHEQTGRRPGLVLSPKNYNSKVGMAVIVPITSQVKGYPFEVKIPDGLKIKGTILSDQIKSFDWQVRDAELICRVSQATFDEVIQKLSALLFQKND